MTGSISHRAVFAVGLAALIGISVGAMRHAPALAHAEAVVATTAIQPLPAEEIADASRTIDRLVDADLARHGQQPNAPTDDERFVRRIHLDLIGRIPTAGEAASFLSDGDPDKRSTLVRRLIGSEGYLSHQFTWWADLLRVETRLGGNGQQPGQPYIDWLKQRLRDNTPYDELVRRLLTAEGHALEADNGATGYWLRDAGMPLDHMANTVRVFLGTQIGCAQCHDHPYDTWTCADFYRMAAFTAGTSVERRLPGEGRGRMKELRPRIEAAGPELKDAFRRLGYTLGLRVQDTGKWHIRLPADYQYADHRPGQEIAARAMFGEQPVLAAPQRDGRKRFARWMTSPSNPRFTTVIANRLWRKAMGVGLIEPVDNLKDDTAATNPDLLRHLERLMVGVGYDLRRFQEAIHTSATYQREVTRTELAAGERYRFPGPVLRRMSAEQAWDSLLTLAVPDLDARKGPDASAALAFYRENKDRTPERILDLAEDIADARREAAALQKEAQALRERLKTARGDDLRSLRARMRELAGQRDDVAARATAIGYQPKKTGKNRHPNGKEILLRASELPQPAPPGHFLHVFGQSDRDLINNAHVQPVIPQALFLMNGLIDSELLKGTSLLSLEVSRAPDQPARMAALFLAIHARAPTADDLALATAFLAANPQDGVKGLAWAMINTDEFLFIR